MSSSFSVDRFKSQLKLSISRLTFLQKKLTSQSLAARKEIADLLKVNKTDQAITKVRYIVRDDFMVEAMEIVQSFCDDLLKSSNLIASTNHCDEFIAEQAKSVIYASNRMDVPELLKVRDLLVAKYSKSILPDREIGVYPRLVLKLSMSYPEKGLCERYLEAIADNFGVDWSVDGSSSGDEEVSDFDNQLHLNSPSPISSSSSSCHSLTANVNHSPSSAAAATDTFTSTVLSSDSPPPPPYSEMKSSAPLPMDYSKQQQQQQQQQQQTKQNLPDFDEFTRRFEALRKK